MRALIVAALCLGGLSMASAAPFASYYWPHHRCRTCAEHKRDTWEAFLDDKLGDQFQHIRTVRLIDRFDGPRPYVGWFFHVVVPVASDVPRDVKLALGGVAIDAPREVVNGSLVFDVVIGQKASGLPRGRHRLVASTGTSVAFTLDIDLEDGEPEDPDPGRVEAEVAAAAKRPPFLLDGDAMSFGTVHLRPRPECGLLPPGAGCTRDTLAMWRDIVLGRHRAHPHARRFVALPPTPGFPGATPYWQFALIFPTAPVDHTLYVLIDGAGKQRISGYVDYQMKSLNMNIGISSSAVREGKHELRVVDGKDKILFVQQVELVR
jgi:hypothetical protein